MEGRTFPFASPSPSPSPPPSGEGSPRADASFKSSPFLEGEPSLFQPPNAHSSNVSIGAGEGGEGHPGAFFAAPFGGGPEGMPAPQPLSDAPSLDGIPQHFYEVHTPPSQQQQQQQQQQQLSSSSASSSSVSSSASRENRSYKMSARASLGLKVDTSGSQRPLNEPLHHPHAAHITTAVRLQAASPQSSPGPASPVTGRKVRRRVKTACTNCKLAKTKCDMQRPCTRCRRRGHEHTCVDTVHKRRGRKRGFDDLFGVAHNLPNSPQSAPDGECGGVGGGGGGGEDDEDDWWSDAEDESLPSSPKLVRTESGSAAPSPQFRSRRLSYSATPASPALSSVSSSSSSAARAAASPRTGGGGSGGGTGSSGAAGAAAAAQVRQQPALAPVTAPNYNVEFVKSLFVLFHAQLERWGSQMDAHPSAMAASQWLSATLCGHLEGSMNTSPAEQERAAAEQCAKVEEQLRAQGIENDKAMFDGLPMGVMIQTLDPIPFHPSNRVWLNKSLQKVLGHDDASVRGMNAKRGALSAVCHISNLAASTRAFTDAISTRSEKYSLRSHWVQRGGERAVEVDETSYVKYSGEEPLYLISWLHPTGSVVSLRPAAVPHGSSRTFVQASVAHAPPSSAAVVAATITPERRRPMRSPRASPASAHRAPPPEAFAGAVVDASASPFRGTEGAGLAMAPAVSPAARQDQGGYQPRHLQQAPRRQHQQHQQQVRHSGLTPTLSRVHFGDDFSVSNSSSASAESRDRAAAAAAAVGHPQAPPMALPPNLGPAPAGDSFGAAEEDTIFSFIGDLGGSDGGSVLSSGLTHDFADLTHSTSAAAGPAAEQAAEADGGGDTDFSGFFS